LQTGAAIERRETPDADFGRVVSITEYERPSDNDDAITAQSIGYMQQLALLDAIHPTVERAALACVREAQLPADASLDDIAQLAIFPWIKRKVRYQPEADLKTPFTHRPGIVDQTLVSPAALLAMPEPAGDCPQFSMLTAAMCRYWSIPSAFKTIAADLATPNTYTHVYCVCQPRPAVFVALDTSNAPGPNLEYARPGKAKLWPLHQDTSKETMIRNAERNRARIGRLADYVGDDYVGGFVDSYPGDAVLPGTYSGGYSDPYAPGGSLNTTLKSGTDWTKLFTTLANDATSIAGPIIARDTRQTPYYIQGAGGAQVLYDPNTGKVATAATTSTTDLASGVRAVTSAIPSTYLLLGAAVLLAFLIIPKK
jgi:hypothetical protein